MINSDGITISARLKEPLPEAFVKAMHAEYERLNNKDLEKLLDLSYAILDEYNSFPPEMESEAGAARKVVAFIWFVYAHKDEYPFADYRDALLREIKIHLSNNKNDEVCYNKLKEYVCRISHTLVGE